MNQKHKFVTDAPNPQYLHEVTIPVNGRRRLLRRGMLLSVNRRPNLPGGKWEFVYAEIVTTAQRDVMLMLHVEGPISRERRHKVIRVSDIKCVHIRTEARPGAG